MCGSSFADFLKCAIAVVAVYLLVLSCTTGRFIHDEASVQRHKQLKGIRAGNVIGSALLTTGSIIFSALIGSDEVAMPESEKQLRKITLSNTSRDTLSINMLTDYMISDSTYCDFMNIRIPPGENCRLLMPYRAVYNLYFSNTPEPDDDEMVEINPGSRRKLILYPGMTKVNNF